MGRPLPHELLQCPYCHSPDLPIAAGAMQCAACDQDFPVTPEQIRFVTVPDSAVSDRLDKLKYRLKSYAKLYNLLIETISPVYFSRRLPKYLKRIPNDAVAINLGSGSSNLSDRLTNVDMFPYASVDITADIEHLPFRTGSIDYIVNIAVLEHVPDPAAVVREIHRVLRPGGQIYCYFPFIQGFHASPHDFTRVTKEGMRHLFRDFDIVDLRPEGGPTSGALWVMQEWLAMLLSFGIRPLYTVLHLALMLLTFPIKLLDVVLIHHPMAENISTAFVVIARKPADAT
jgi:SAM-dependent methyltransferase